MIYPELLENKIGFNRIGQLLRNECLTALSEQYAEEMDFLTDYATIQEELSFTNEYLTIRAEEDGFELGGFYDLREALNSIGPIGSWLNEKSFAELRTSLETLHKLQKFFHGERKINYPLLSQLITELPSFDHLVQDIKRVFNDEGEIKDNASPELLKIRQSLHREQQQLSKRIQSVLSRAKKDGLIEEGISPSVRDGRLVIPVEARNKRKINGIVHDESATGKTAFIEPAEVVEANNRIRELEMEERREIVKILQGLTELVRPEAENIIQALHVLGKIDFLRSKSVMCGRLQAIVPDINNEAHF